MNDGVSVQNCLILYDKWQTAASSELLTFTLQQYLSLSCLRRPSSSCRSALSSFMSGCREGLPMIFSLRRWNRIRLTTMSRCCDQVALKKCWGGRVASRREEEEIRFSAAHCSPKMLQLIEISANCDDGGGFVLLQQRMCDILNEDVFF